MNITRGMSRMLLAIGLFSVMGAFIAKRHIYDIINP